MSRLSEGSISKLRALVSYAKSGGSPMNVNAFDLTALLDEREELRTLLGNVCVLTICEREGELPGEDHENDDDGEPCDCRSCELRRAVLAGQAALESRTDEEKSDV